MALTLLLISLPALAVASKKQTANVSHQQMDRLFSTNPPTREWAQFKSEGFKRPVSGVIFRTNKTPCCGVPLGGIGTGCIDIDASGTFGMSTIFSDYTLNQKIPGCFPRGVPRMPASYSPFLGLSVGKKTWVLASSKIVEGGRVQSCAEPGVDKTPWMVTLPKIEGVKTAKEIHYFGHYPVVDMEYDTDAPVEVGLRAWAPFIPGDEVVSNHPGSVFEVHLRNRTEKSQRGTVAFSFLGPADYEARGAKEFKRKPIRSSGMSGVEVSAVGMFKAEYLVGVIGAGDKARFGGGLDRDGAAWSKIESALPRTSGRKDGHAVVSAARGVTAAVDFNLKPGQARTGFG